MLNRQKIPFFLLFCLSCECLDFSLLCWKWEVAFYSAKSVLCQGKLSVKQHLSVNRTLPTISPNALGNDWLLYLQLRHEDPVPHPANMTINSFNIHWSGSRYSRLMWRKLLLLKPKFLPLCGVLSYTDDFSHSYILLSTDEKFTWSVC